MAAPLLPVDNRAVQRNGSHADSKLGHRRRTKTKAHDVGGHCGRLLDSVQVRGARRGEISRLHEITGPAGHDERANESLRECFQNHGEQRTQKDCQDWWANQEAS